MQSSPPPTPRHGSTEDFLAAIEAQTRPADDFVVICTSGTTAEPKAVAHTHGSAIRNTWAYTPLTGLRTDDRIFNTMPFFWVGGFLRVLLPALFEGAAIVFSDTLRPADAVEVMLRERITFLNLGYGSFHGLREEAARRGADLSFIRAGFGPPLDASGQIIPARTASRLGAGDDRDLRHP